MNQQKQISDNGYGKEVTLLIALGVIALMFTDDDKFIFPVAFAVLMFWLASVVSNLSPKKKRQ